MAFFEIQLQRKQEIEENLLKQMRDTPYEQITVKNLTEGLQIARKTFYHYFPSKQACLESMVDRIIQECDLAVMAMPNKADSFERCMERMRFWSDHRAFLDAIDRNSLEYLFIDRIMLYTFRENDLTRLRLSTEQMPCDEDILYFYISSQILLLLKWSREGFSLSPEDMARKTLRLMYEPLLSQRGQNP